MLKRNIITVILMLIISTTISYGSEISIYIDGQKLETDQPPIVQNGRTLVPLRAIGEGLGGKVSWDNDSKMARISYTDINGLDCSAEFYIDQQDYKGYYYYLKVTNTFQRFSMDVKPQLINGYTYLPLRACAESLDCNVEWNENTNTIKITKATDLNNFVTTSTYKATALEEFYEKIDSNITSSSISNSPAKEEFYKLYNKLMEDLDTIESCINNHESIGTTITIGGDYLKIFEKYPDYKQAFEYLRDAQNNLNTTITPATVYISNQSSTIKVKSYESVVAENYNKAISNIASARANIEKGKQIIDNMN